MDGWIREKEEMEWDERCPSSPNAYFPMPACICMGLVQDAPKNKRWSGPNGEEEKRGG